MSKAERDLKNPWEDDSNTVTVSALNDFIEIVAVEFSTTLSFMTGRLTLPGFSTVLEETSDGVQVCRGGASRLV